MYKKLPFILNEYGNIKVIDLTDFISIANGRDWSWDSSFVKKIDAKNMNYLASSNLGHNLVSNLININEINNSYSSGFLTEKEVDKLKIIQTNNFCFKNVDFTHLSSGTQVFVGSEEDLSCVYILSNNLGYGGIVLTGDKWDVCPNAINTGLSYLYIPDVAERKILNEKSGDKKLIELHRKSVDSRAKIFRNFNK